MDEDDIYTEEEDKESSNASLSEIIALSFETGLDIPYTTEGEYN